MKKLFLFILACCAGVLVYGAVVQNQFVTNSVSSIATGPGVVGPVWITANTLGQPTITAVGIGSSLVPILHLTNTSGASTAIRFIGGGAESDIQANSTGFNFYGPPTPASGLMLTLVTNAATFVSGVTAPTFTANSTGGGKLTLTEPVSGQTVTEYASGTNFFVQVVSTNSVGALNTNTFNMGNNVNGNLFRFQGTNNTDLIKMDQGGNLTVVGNITNSVLTASTLAGTDANKAINSVTVGSGLTLSGGTLSASGGGGSGWLTFYDNITVYAGGNGVNSTRYNPMLGGIAVNQNDNGSAGGELMYFQDGGIISNICIALQSGSFTVPSTTNTFFGIYTNTFVTAAAPTTVVLSPLFLTYAGGYSQQTNSGTASVTIASNTWACIGWTNNAVIPVATKTYALSWQFKPN